MSSRVPRTSSVYGYVTEQKEKIKIKIFLSWFLMQSRDKCRWCKPNKTHFHNNIFYGSFRCSVIGRYTRSVGRSINRAFVLTLRVSFNHERIKYNEQQRPVKKAYFQYV